MKRFAIVIAIVAMLGLYVCPALASDRPSLDALIDDYYAKSGEAVPEASWGYLYDLVTNAYNQGWGSIFVATNNNRDLRIQIVAFIVPTGAEPGEEVIQNIFLNPYEVRYINLSAFGLGSENAWALLFSTQSDFGSGVLLYCTNPSNPGIAWEKGWYFYNP